MGPDQFIVFFREFDQFFAFEASDDTTRRSTIFSTSRRSGPASARPLICPHGPTQFPTPTVKNAAQFLSDNQLRVITQHFGDPLDQNSLNEALWQFGKGSLPPDNQRPQDRFHRMNGSSMWMMWLAFADASIRSGMNVPQWTNVAKCICLGLVGDALFRTDRPPSSRLKITRYRADDATLQQRVIGDFANLSGDDLLDAMIESRPRG